jgi:cell division protease FtsH
MQVLRAPTPYVLPQRPRAEPKRLSDFITSVKKHEVREALIKPNVNKVLYIGDDDSLNQSNYVYTPELWKSLIDDEVAFDVDTSTPFSATDAFSMWFTLFLAFYFGRMLFSRGGGGPPNPFDVNKTEFELEKHIPTRFEDVQGIDSARDELGEIVDFLKEPEKYMITGARIPKGALLTGKPGTGKTLLARAIAGESSVPFIQCSGSSFVEMFVGVGAKRVRDVFELARKNQPCIVFIDEIDAIGKKRSAGGFPANDEREQTINQLLTEMDGFDNTSQIVVIAATNRADILDEALLRPGRFDRKIQVALPSVAGRRKILDVHANNKNLDASVDLDTLAKQTTGFSGADLANLMNECAIRGAREGTIITPTIVENVYQRIVVGAVGDVKFSMRKKELVAYHEAGHAIMGVLVPEFDTLRKVSIIPRGAAGGITFFQPTEENADSALYTKEYLMSQIKVALGGRAAEEIIYGVDRITTGASSDYARVYSIAREMVTTYGFGQRNFDVNNLSPEAAHVIDMEIDALVAKAYEETKDTLGIHIKQLELIKDRLIEEEIVEGSWIYTLFECSDTSCPIVF